MMNLTALKMGATGHISHINASIGMGRRLMDLGFTQGAAVQCLLCAPGRGMRAYAVRGAVIALRFRDATQIFLEEYRHA